MRVNVAPEPDMQDLRSKMSLLEAEMTERWPEGTYEIRATLTDAPGNPVSSQVSCFVTFWESPICKTRNAFGL